MKKLIFLLATGVILCLQEGFAQDSPAPFRFGFKLSPNLGWMKPNATNYESEGLTGGLSWGFVGEYSLAANYSIVSGFDVAAANGKLKYPSKYIVGSDTMPGTMHRKYLLKYVEIPVMLKMKTNQIGYLTYFGQIGLGSSFNLNAKANDEFQIEGSTGQRIKTEKKNIKDDVKFIRESMIIGLGVEYTPGGAVTFVGSLVFNNGFSDVLKKKNLVDPTIAEDAISNYLELNLGILF